MTSTLKIILNITAGLSLTLGVAFGYGEHIQSLSADFIQQIVSEDGIPAHYEGKLIAKAPDKVKWLYTKPLQKEIYMQQREVIIYEPSLEQASYSRLKENSDFISIIKAAQKDSNGTYRAMVDKVEYVLFVDSEQNPEHIEFVDTMGAKTILSLKNVKINTKISDKSFNFTPPEGTEIVEMNK